MAETKLIYLGPNYMGFMEGKVYTGGVPLNLTAVYTANANVQTLLVSIAQSAAVLANRQKPGTPEYAAYKALGGTVATPAEQVPPPPTASSTGPIDVTLQDKITTGNGTPYSPTSGNTTLTFSVRGTSTSRTILFELADPSGVYLPCTAFGVNDPTKMATQTMGGNDTAPESWQVTVPAGWSFRARIGAAAGGNVTIKGKAVE